MEISQFLKEKFYEIISQDSDSDVEYLIIVEELSGVTKEKKSFMQNIIDKNKAKNLSIQEYNQLYEIFLNELNKNHHEIKNIEEEKHDVNLINPIVQKGPAADQLFLIEKHLKCLIKYKNIDIDELKPYFRNFLNTFTNRKLFLPFENMRFYNLVNEINIRDELGEWKYDPLQGCLSITFQLRNENKFFPKNFQILKDYFNLDEKSIEYSLLEEKPKIFDQKEDILLEDFLKMVIKINRKDPANIFAWSEKFKNQFIERVEELVEWEDADWDKCNLEPNIKRLIRKELARYKYKSYSNLNQKLSKSEILSITHRIKRFLIYTVNEKDIEELEYIDQRAVQAGYNNIYI